MGSAAARVGGAEHGLAISTAPGTGMPWAEEAAAAAAGEGEELGLEG